MQDVQKYRDQHILRVNEITLVKRVHVKLIKLDISKNDLSKSYLNFRKFVFIVLAVIVNVRNFFLL